jgi:hypothetical protein
MCELRFELGDDVEIEEMVKGLLNTEFTEGTEKKKKENDYRRGEQRRREEEKELRIEEDGFVGALEVDVPFERGRIGG